ncbi:MAG: cytochrome c oxidase subunit 3 [Pyrinomonadaceae bacterium]
MATRVTSTRPKTQKGTGGGPKVPGPNGKGPGGNGYGGEYDSQYRFSAARYRITTWVVLAAIVMMFAALSSSYIILSGGERWQPVTMPRMFYLSTAIIVTSSLCFEAAKRSLKRRNEAGYGRWLGFTLFLGIAFLMAQLLGWRELASQGVYFEGHPHRSFFYLFTAVHGVHLLGGIVALIYLLARTRSRASQKQEKTAAVAAMVSVYWHMMDVLWIWLFALLLLWR